MTHFIEFAAWLWSIGETPENYHLYTDEPVALCDLNSEFTRLDRMYAADERTWRKNTEPSSAFYTWHPRAWKLFHCIT